MKFKVKLINMFFGKQPLKRFKRLVVLLLVVGIILISLFTCNFRYDKQNGLQFWNEPIDADVKIGKGE